jgi:hypothetical protein
VELAEQVTNLELSKRLKELGIKQESLFYYSLDHCESGQIAINILYDIQPFFEEDDFYSAFTVAELGKMIPSVILAKSVSSTDIPIIFQKYFDNLFCIYGQLQNGMTYPVYTDNTEANARAKFLIYLIENNLISEEFLCKKN